MSKACYHCIYFKAHDDGCVDGVQYTDFECVEKDFWFWNDDFREKAEACDKYEEED